MDRQVVMANRIFYKSLTDDELYILIRKDRAAESEFYRRFKIRVKFFLKNYSLNSLEREDLIQEGMIGVFQALQTFDPAKGIRFSTYSSVCIKNRIKNALESLFVHKKRFDQNSDIENIVSEQTPESVTIALEMTEKLKNNIRRLEDTEKSVLSLYLAGKSYKDMAQELAISTKKVDNILRKIKQKLAVRLSKADSEVYKALSMALKETVKGGPE